MELSTVSSTLGSSLVWLLHICMVILANISTYGSYSILQSSNARVVPSLVPTNLLGSKFRRPYIRISFLPHSIHTNTPSPVSCSITSTLIFHSSRSLILICNPYPFHTCPPQYNTRWFLFHADTVSKRSSLRSLPRCLKTLPTATPISELKL